VSGAAAAPEMDMSSKLTNADKTGSSADVVDCNDCVLTLRDLTLPMRLMPTVQFSVCGISTAAKIVNCSKNWKKYTYVGNYSRKDDCVGLDLVILLMFNVQMTQKMKTGTLIGS